MVDDLAIVPPANPSPEFIAAEQYLGWHRMAKLMDGEDGPVIEIAACLKPSAEEIRAIHQRQAGRGQ